MVKSKFKLVNESINDQVEGVDSRYCVVALVGSTLYSLQKHARGIELFTFFICFVLFSLKNESKKPTSLESS